MSDKASTEDPLDLIPSLCAQFYHLGWVTGTGGGISIRSVTDSDLIYVAPSGVQKERMKREDLFILSLKKMSQSGEAPFFSNSIVHRPSAALTQSQCTPLFHAAYTKREAGACIHTHSSNAVLVTMMTSESHWKISHQEMIKGVMNEEIGRMMRFDETLVIPIIENTAEERDLTTSLEQAMEQYRASPAVLVRNHGIYVWGKTWQKAKTITECIDYLLGLAVECQKMGISVNAKVL